MGDDVGGLALGVPRRNDCERGVAEWMGSLPRAACVWARPITIFPLCNDDSIWEMDAQWAGNHRHQQRWGLLLIDRYSSLTFSTFGKALKFDSRKLRRLAIVIWTAERPCASSSHFPPLVQNSRAASWFLISRKRAF